MRVAAANTTQDETASPWGIWYLATLGWALIFLGAVYLGRLTVISGTSLNLLWPAAGVAVVWLALHRRSPVLWLDALALAAITTGADVATGAPLLLGAGFAGANLAQTAITVVLFTRWCPELWLNGGSEPFGRVSQFWKLVAAAGTGSAAGATIGPAAVSLFGHGPWSWLLTGVWLTRNTAGIVLAGVVALQLEYVWSGTLMAARTLRRPPWVSRRVAAKHWLQRRASRHSWEGLALCLASAACYIAVFPYGHQIPMGFILLSVTVWAGLRFSTTFVAIHGLVISVAAAIFTLNGQGPWAAIGFAPERALITQLFVGMVATIGLCLSLGRRERSELLLRAQAAEHDARSQADVFATIVETMRPGLVVVGANGEPMLGNMAAHRLTSVGDVPASRSPGPSARIPASGPAPATPPPAIDELPYQEALAGQIVSSADVVISGGSTDERRTLNVSAAPLPARVGGGAVLVFNDVTQDRREREDLAAFAGIVAHDLLNPLTAMSGWADLLDSLLSRAAPDPMVSMAAESLTWIKEAADRASTLVGELLTYTTAGDAPITASDVDLARLVDDVIAERTRRLMTESTDGTTPPSPQFEVGALGHVLADPVLIRQLISNLIENAVKYVAPETIPQISIGMSEASEGWSRVYVADHGIGIPPGEHDAIFQNFHRAHRDSDYSGSGIGLSICRRIVERHGGTIIAQDNEGGGTRFVFALPTATAEPAKVAAPVRDSVRV